MRTCEVEVAYDSFPSSCASEHMGHWIQSEAFRTCKSVLTFGNIVSRTHSIPSFWESDI